MNNEIEVKTQATQMVEIGGSMFEVAVLRKTTAFKIGDKVKLLEKLNQRYEVHAGVIVGFDAFKDLPTVTVAYVQVDYYGAKMKFVHINKQTDDYDLAPMDIPALEVDKENVLTKFDAEIEKNRTALEKVEAEKQWFLTNFGKYFDIAA